MNNSSLVLAYYERVIKTASFIQYAGSVIVRNEFGIFAYY